MSHTFQKSSSRRTSSIEASQMHQRRRGGLQGSRDHPYRHLYYRPSLLQTDRRDEGCLMKPSLQHLHRRSLSVKQKQTLSKTMVNKPSCWLYSFARCSKAASTWASSSRNPCSVQTSSMNASDSGPNEWLYFLSP